MQLNDAQQCGSVYTPRTCGDRYATELFITGGPEYDTKESGSDGEGTCRLSWYTGMRDGMGCDGCGVFLASR
ncbi:hypothetical protein JCM10550A_00580 [Methanogenium cariaci]